jgi:predicted glycosyltransferase
LDGGVRVWIDMSNSPHPLLFGPIAKVLERDGHEVLVTTRDNAQTRQLTLERWPRAAVVGGSSPARRAPKAAAIGKRVIGLRRWAITAKPDLAFSHNSYAQILAARSLGIRTVTAMDYEHQPINHLAFRLANRVVLPEAFPADSARHQGARQGKSRRFRGFKEEIYLGEFEPRREALSEAGLADNDRTLVVARTPPTGATYHRFENPVFDRLLEGLKQDDGCVCVLLARTPEQRVALRDRVGANFVVPERAVDSRSLVHQADLFVGAGGTMAREAALMGIPTVSLYAGRRPAADVELERRGDLRVARSYEEVGPIARRTAEPRTPVQLSIRAKEVTDAFLMAALG